MEKSAREVITGGFNAAAIRRSDEVPKPTTAVQRSVDELRHLSEEAHDHVSKLEMRLDAVLRRGAAEPPPSAEVAAYPETGVPLADTLNVTASILAKLIQRIAVLADRVEV